MTDASHRHFENAKDLASRLLSMLREIRVSDWEGKSATFSEHGGQFKETFGSDLLEALATVKELARRLDKTLKAAGFESEELAFEAADRPDASSIRVIIREHAPRKIHGGFLQPVFHGYCSVSGRVTAFLISIPGYEDVLVREHHGFLWHYHYLNVDKKRSDVILCWDTRIVPKPPAVRPIFQEKHGKGFLARPDLWGDHKKQTIFSVAHPDLDKWPIEEFRCASNKAQPVWPKNAQLTPVSTPTALKHAARRGRQRRR